MNILGITAQQTAAAWTPAGKAYVWYDAADTSTISVTGNSVTEWRDKGSAGFHLSQATGSRQPQSGTNTQNGRNVIKYDGGDVLVNTTKSNWTWMHDGTKYVSGAVVKMRDASTTEQDLYVWTNIRRGQGDLTGNMLSQDTLGSAGRTNALLRIVRTSTVANVIINVNNVWEETDVVCYTDLSDPNNATAADRMKSYFGTGAAVGTNTQTGAVTTNDPTVDIGFGAADNINTAGMSGFIAEIVFLQSPYNTEAERQNLRGYLMSKWGI